MSDNKEKNFMEELQDLMTEYESLSREASALDVEQECLKRSLSDIESSYAGIVASLDSIFAGDPWPDGKARGLGRSMALFEAIVEIHRHRQALLTSNIAAVAQRHADMDRRARDLHARIGSSFGTA